MSSENKSNRRIEQHPHFYKIAKKLHPDSKKELDNAVRAILENPKVGEAKKGDLVGIRVLKFRMQNQLTLLAYTYDEIADLISLKLFGSHENFYRDLKR